METIAFGSTNDVRAQIRAKDGSLFTLTDVTVTTSNAESGAVVEDDADGYAETGEVAAATHNVYYHGEFTAANGYAPGVAYLAEFRGTAQLGATSYAGAYAKASFCLAAVADG